MKRLFLALLFLAGTAFAQEELCINVLKSNASPREKAEACRVLARLGTKESVPALATLLADEHLSLMARYALEPIADPAVDAVLREALGTLQGRLLVGVISSLGVRQDPQAVAPLAQLLSAADPAVAQAAARALGCIGAPALPSLQKALPSSPPALQLAVCEGLLRAAEILPAAEAVAVYDQMRSVPNLPHHVRVAALWGAIRGRGAQGLPLLVESIRTASYVPAADAIRMSMDLPGPEVTKALVAELAPAEPEKQILLLQTLAYRGDASAAPALVPLARGGPAPRRIAALRSLVQLGHPSSIPALVDLIKDPETTVAGAAMTGLIGFAGPEADAAIVAQLNDPDRKIRIALIDGAGQRRIPAAIPVLLRAAAEAEAGVATAGFKALGEYACLAEIPAVVDALRRTKAVGAGETALAAICARQPDPARCTEKLLPGLAQAQGEPKLALLRVLGTVGDPTALNAVRAAASGADESIKDTALRTLCDWPNALALSDLTHLALTTSDSRFKILALRGQLRLIPTQTLADAQKLAQLKEVLPLIDRPEEQRLVLGLLGSLPNASSLALVQPFLNREGLKEEAASAAVAIGEKIVDTHPVAVAEAMQKVQTANNDLAGRAKKLLARVPKEALEEGFNPIFNGKDLSGWETKPGWWTVQDGALTAESTPEKPCKECNYLIWRDGLPADFELRAEFKISLAANSGIQIRSEERPDWDTFGYQADMSGDGELVGFVYHHSRGLIAGRGEKAVFDAEGKKTVESLGDPKELLKHFKPGDWNTYCVVARGADISLRINGVLMCQITDHHATLAAKRGIIALQMHPGPPMKVQFKNLRLKELK